MAVAVASVATGDAGGISTIAALDASQQAGLRQELAVLQQLYFTPECEARLGLPLDPEGGASRAAAQDGSHSAGDAFPLDHRLTDSNGAETNLRALVERGPFIVVFFRGTWCTLCSLALRHLSACLPMLREGYGAKLVAVSGQLPQHNFACEVSNQLAFPVLCDKGLALAQELAICYSLTEQEARFYNFICNPDFESVYGADHGFQLPLPATFVLAPRTGRIGYAFVDQDLTKCSRLLRIEAVLQDLTLGGGGGGGGLQQLQRQQEQDQPPAQQQQAWQSE